MPNKSKPTITRRRGQRASLIGGNSYAAEKLACMLGIPTLKHLTDEDIRDLLVFMRYFADVAADDAFKAGWDAASLYNHDARLCGEQTRTEH